MTFEELSSKLGGIYMHEEVNGHNRVTGTHTNLAGMVTNPFYDVSSSAQISMCTPVGSNDVSMNQSIDFANIPELLEPLDAQNQVGLESPGKAKFDYEHRFFNHFNVNKMTNENQAFATMNRGSFAENMDKRLDRPDYTGDSEQIINKLSERPNFFLNNNHALISPLKGIESQTFLRGIETPTERTDLYDNFDIHHERLHNLSEVLGPDSAANTVVDSVRTMSVGGTS